MRILKRYILREIAWPAFLALAVIAFIFVISEIREKKDVAYAYATAVDILQMMIFLMPAVLPILIPMAYMMGILLAFGTLAQSNEITAMKAAGIPLKRVIAPVLLGGVALAGVTFLVQDRVQPAALRQFARIAYVDMAVRGTLDVLPAGVMHKFGDWRVYIGAKDPVHKTLRDVNILIPGKNGSMVLNARTATLVENGKRRQIVLKEGYLARPQSTGQLLIGPAGPLVLDLPSLAERAIPGRLQLLTMGQLLRFQTGQGTEAEYGGVNPADTRQIREARLEIGKRLAFPLACIAVCIVAAPLAVRSRRGGRSYSFAIGFSIGLVFFLLYYVLQPQSLKPLPEVVLRSIAPCLVLGLAGGWFLWRVDRV